MTQTPLPNPTDLISGMNANASNPTPVLPTQWRAQVLLTPYGHKDAPMTNYSQLVVADVSYDYSEQSMRTSLYLTEDLTYYDFLFINGLGWYWLVSSPGGPITDYFGPFATPLQVPAPNFLSRPDTRYGYFWPIMGTSTQSWVIPTPNNGNPPDHGSWYSFRVDNGNLFRIFTFDSNNPVLIPILGSYYLANVPTFTPSAPSDATREVVRSIKSGKKGVTTDYSNTLVTQENIQSAMAKPLASAPCTLQQIQALIPGLVPTPAGTLPQWTDKTAIVGYTIGTDFIPYPTQVYYWYSHGRQQTIFIGIGLIPGQGTFNDRQDSCLYSLPDPSKDYTNLPQYYWDGQSWVPQCCDGTLQGIGVPKPNWTDGGRIMASITGNASFGLSPGEVMNLVAVPSVRPDTGEEALFWVWFTADQKGVLFTEANFLDSTDHSLQLIDYQLFLRNATWIDPSIFSDPCPSLPACPAPAPRKSWPRAMF